MGSSLSFDSSGIKEITKRFENPAIRQELEGVVRLKSILALIIQAINDNFDKEGPGWAPLKASTIRQSVSKKLRKQLTGLGDKELLKHEARARKAGESPSRHILQKTDTLRKTATTPGATFTNKNSGQTGSNIYRTENTNLIWGTNLIYAGTHNNGMPSKNIPKREFMVIRKDWEEKLQKFVFEKYMSVIRKFIGGKNV